MNRNAIKTVLVAAATFTSSMAFAAESAPPASSPQGGGDMSMHHQMKPDGGMDGMKGMDGGMKGMGGMGAMKAMMGGDDMMGMMRSCHAMMNKKRMSGGSAMPQLPPGNEKLEFRMHAEMMQKMGEIAVKYADQIKESP